MKLTEEMKKKASSEFLSHMKEAMSLYAETYNVPKSAALKAVMDFRRSNNIDNLILD